MTERDAQTIRYMAQKGATQKTIAKVYGVNPRKIRRVLNGEDLEIKPRAKPEEGGAAEAAKKAAPSDDAGSRPPAGRSAGSSDGEKPSPGNVNAGVTAGRDRHPNGTVRRNPQAVSRLLKEATRPAVTSWRPATCQYIAGDGRKDADKCGAPVQEGSPYCKKHYSICYYRKSESYTDESN